MPSEPWKLVEYGNGSCDVVDSKDILLFSSGCPAHATSGEMRKAAAAPDLYTAVEAALNMVDGDGTPPRWDMLRAALAKARGEKSDAQE